MPADKNIRIITQFAAGGGCTGLGRIAVRFLLLFAFASAALGSQPAAAQNIVWADSTHDEELCNLPAEVAAPRRDMTDKERSEVVMTALAARKAAIAGAGCRAAHRAARRSFDLVWRTCTRRHELTASYGLFPASWSYGYAAGFDGGGYSFLQDGHTYNYSDIRSSGGFAAGYMYRLSRRWSVGLSASLSKTGRDLSVDGLKVSEDRNVTFGITPAVRLNWIDRPMVKCYSEIQIGYAYDTFRTDAGDGVRLRHSYFFVTPTVAGISVGRRLHGIAELGAGLRGLVCAGIGYSL